MKFEDGPTTEASLTMRASTAAIWAACIDPALPLENSPELIAAHWDPDGPPPGLGARLVGTNRMGDREWTTVSNVVSWEPEARWSFEVGEGQNAASQWWYELTDHQDGTVTVTQRVRLGPGQSGLSAAIEAKPDIEEKIIEGRLDFMNNAMAANLQAIEARAAS